MSCPICFKEKKGLFTIKTPCEHIFCLQCFLKLRDLKCPLCRNELKNGLPGFLVNYYQNKKNIESIHLRNIIDINDEHEFPQL